MIHSLELTETQKKEISKKYTEILSESTNVPQDKIYIFFNGYPLDGIAAGGVLNSEFPDSALKQFNIQYSADLIENEAIRVASRMKVKPGKEDEAHKALMALLLKTRDEKGCLSYDLYKSKFDILNEKDCPSYFLLKEKWRDGEAINFHVSTDFFGEFMSKGSDLFDGTIEVTKRVESLRKNDKVDPTGKLITLVRFKAKKGNEELINDGLIDVMKSISEKKACKMYDLYQGFEGIYDPSVFFTYQIWESFDDFNEARKKLFVNMPFPLDDLDEPRQAITFEMVSKLAVK